MTTCIPLTMVSRSQYENCKLNISQINGCLDLASRAIVLASWLAATTRKELVRFKEFMKWLKYGRSSFDARLRPV